MRIPVAPLSLPLPDLEQCDMEDLDLLDEILGENLISFFLTFAFFEVAVR